MILPAVLLLHLLLPSAESLDNFPHPYVAHPKPHHGPPGHQEAHGEVHLPEHHQGEHKLPRKCHTDYVSVVSKVGSDHDDDNDDDDDDDDDRSVTRCMRSSAPRTRSTSTRLSTWRSVRISTTNNVVHQPGESFSPNMN